jgi:hypothetical protein
VDTRISHLNNKPFFKSTRQENTQAETKQGGKNFSRPTKFTFPFFLCAPSLVTARRNSTHYNRIMESLFFTAVSNSYPGARRSGRS